MRGRRRQCGRVMRFPSGAVSGRPRRGDSRFAPGPLPQNACHPLRAGTDSRHPLGAGIACGEILSRGKKRYRPAVRSHGQQPVPGSVACSAGDVLRIRPPAYDPFGLGVGSKCEKNVKLAWNKSVLKTVKLGSPGVPVLFGRCVPGWSSNFCYRHREARHDAAIFVSFCN